MSKHPDDAAHGYSTVEHVLLRLEAMLRVAVGEPADGGVAHDEDGFIRALVAPGWQRDEWRLQLDEELNDFVEPRVMFAKK